MSVVIFAAHFLKTPVQCTGQVFFYFRVILSTDSQNIYYPAINNPWDMPFIFND